DRPRPAGEALLAMQRHYGNRYVEQAVIQAKLVVGPPRDRYEREADRIAQAVVRGVTGPGKPDVQPVTGPGRPDVQPGTGARRRAQGRPATPVSSAPAAGGPVGTGP